jgi:uncharacterized membrane-anchored protein
LRGNRRAVLRRATITVTAIANHPTKQSQALRATARDKARRALSPAFLAAVTGELGCAKFT